MLWHRNCNTIDLFCDNFSSFVCAEVVHINRESVDRDIEEAKKQGWIINRDGDGNLTKVICPICQKGKVE